MPTKNDVPQALTMKMVTGASDWLLQNTVRGRAAGDLLLTELVQISTVAHPARTAPITGRYSDPASLWAGWIEDDARTWVAFVAKTPERFTLLWEKRDASGGVKGDPVCFFREEGAERTIETRAREEMRVSKTVKAHGATFNIDRPVGHTKKGKGFDGKPYELTYTCDYGYLCKTHEGKEPPIGGDGMLIDAYCCAPGTRADDGDGDDDAAPPSSKGERMIHVVNQIDPKTREPDEQKLILNAHDMAHAARVYGAHTPARCFGSMFTMTGDAFRAQLAACAPGQRLTFMPAGPEIPTTDEPPSTKRGADLAADRTRVHASQEPYQMPRPHAPVAADHHHLLQRDAGASGDDDRGADLFTRVVSAERAYTREIEGKRRVCVDFVMSTEAKDNHGTILRAKWNLKRFNTNPVFLYMHNRREDRPPIGVMENVRVENKQLLGTAILSDVSEFDREIAEKYLQRIMRGGSVGFNPGSITVEIIDGEETVVFDDIELLEFSAACVPSNPETIAKLAEQRARCLEIGRAASGFAEGVCRGAVPHRKYPLDQSMTWDAAAAEKKVRAWATVGGKINWGRYAQAFGWVDPEKSDSFDGYKLIHHTVSPDGKTLVTVRGGLIAAGNAIQGARGGVKIPPGDLPAVKAHLAEHYKEFGLAPPWEKKKAIANDTPDPTETHHMPHDIRIRLLDTADTAPTTDKKSRAHGVQPCEVTCPGCQEQLRVLSELPESVLSMERALSEQTTLLKSEQLRAAALEKKLTDRSADMSALLIKMAQRDLADLTGKQIDPTQVDIELELARHYFEDETRDEKGQLVGIAKWEARVAKLKALPDQKLAQRTIPAAKPGDGPTKPAEDAAAKVDAEGRTRGGDALAARMRDSKS